MYVITRQGYTGREFLTETGRWSNHSSEALAFFGSKTAEQFLAEIRCLVAYPIRLAKAS